MGLVRVGCKVGGIRTRSEELALKEPDAGAAPHPDANGTPSLEDNPLLAKFDRLIDDLITGQIQRSKFDQWEMEILLDFDAFAKSMNRRAVLSAYRKAVHRQMTMGATHPMRLSEFLAARRKA